MMKIAICCPGENFSCRWVQNWTMLFAQLIQHDIAPCPIFDFTSNVYHTRNMMAEFCLKNKDLADLDYVLWIDDDNIVDFQQVSRLLGHLQTRPEIDAVFGWAWCEQSQYEAGAIISCGFPDSTVPGGCRPFCPSELIGQTQLMEVGYSGFPVALMRASLLHRLGTCAFAPIISPDYWMGYSSEDVAFCHRAIAAGAKLYVDPLCQVPHLKQRSIEPKHDLTTGNLKFWRNEKKQQQQVSTPEETKEECAA